MNAWNEVAQWALIVYAILVAQNPKPDHSKGNN